MKWVKRILIVVVVLIAALGAFIALSNEKRPVGTPGPEADALAHKVQSAVGVEHWNELGAILFTYAERHTVLWDRTRNFVRVDFGSKRAMYKLADMSGRAWDNNQDVSDAGARAKILTEGHKWFINDTFWLNPFVSLFDSSVTRALASDKDGKQGLLISYASGGVTPGDAYLWFVGDDGLPNKWKMWVSVIPVGGVAATWDNWKELPGGAKVSTEHKSLIKFGVTDLKAGKTLADVMPGEDPFKALEVSTATASSQPAT